MSTVDAMDPTACAAKLLEAAALVHAAAGRKGLAEQHRAKAAGLRVPHEGP